MKVLVISATFPPMKSGGADHAFRLSQRLAEAGLEIHVVTSKIDGGITDASMDIYPVMRSWSWLELPRLLKIVRRCRPDVVNLHFSGGIYHDQPMVTFVPALVKKFIPHVRVVTQIEYPEEVRVDLSPLSMRALRKLVAYWVGNQEVDYGYGTILRDSDRIIVLSEEHRIILSKHLASVDKKCVLIPPPPIMTFCTETNGVGRSRAREALRVTHEEFLIAFYGYLYPRKGIETLLEAFHLFARRREKVRLVFVGGSNEVVLERLRRPHYVEELRGLTRQLGLADKVLWTGYYPTDSDTASLYLRGADACVLPFDDGVMLHRSSFAAVAAHGLPTITTRGKVLESPFIDQKNVLLCPPMNPQALADAMEKLVDNPELRQRLSEGALEMTREWFSWDKAVKRTIETFKGDG